MSLSHTELNSELADYGTQLEQIDQKLHQLADALTEQQFQWQPKPGRWSISGCVQHLTLTTERFLPLIDSAMQQGRAKGWLSEGPFRHPRFVSWLIRQLEPPYRLKTKTPASFAPQRNEPKNAVLAGFFGSQRELQARLQQANGLDLVRIRIRSPFLPLLQYTLGQTFAEIAIHERRHLWQAQQVRQHPQFPAA